MRRWIATFGGAGMSPVAPGTVGSLAASLVLLGIYWAVLPSATVWLGILLAGLVLASAGTVAVGPWAAGFYGRKDPGSFVLDEVAGICLTMLFQPMDRNWLVFLITFVAFRLFDVWKPWPCRRLEQFPAGWGILADDLGAAIYANLLSQIILRLLF